ncbi:hypothetical protein GH865_08700 [Rhodocyclus tenuis]|uniref:hypothetical protein n=1 Tax=Rhodocyclus gracilis TaxID=2929842 RepID=UPI001298AC40|nr:hypothetical protein [Rhodocyclus gracilis]MRD73326.1 hypothetical protein [Rhodocyclus gracilis]
MARRDFPFRRTQRGSALLILALLLVGIIAGSLLMQSAGASRPLSRDDISQIALRQAKEALIGFAATYRDTHPDQVFGYLPCPDSDNDGIADSCGTTDTPLLGRLPWKTLGIAPLRDGSGECLWYAVSGSSKDAPKTASMNWDTPGQFIVRDVDQTLLAGASDDARAVAVILAPDAAMPGQARTPVSAPPASACGGNNSAGDYLEGATFPATPLPPGSGAAPVTITVARAARRSHESNNDRGLALGNAEIFTRIKARADFRQDIASMLNELAACLNKLPPAALPAASPDNKGMDAVLALCPGSSPLKAALLANWRDNLLYARPAQATSVNGIAGCRGVLFFGGERRRGQLRETLAQRRDASNYLDDEHLAQWQAGGPFVAASDYDPAAPANDLVRCVTGLPVAATQFSFASDLERFASSGETAGTRLDGATASVSLVGAASGRGSCLWLATPIPLAGKTLRGYYDFRFRFADTSALATTPDSNDGRGNGFALQLLPADSGLPGCGQSAHMGALRPSDGWLSSLLIETDVRPQRADDDPMENHTAIMINGLTEHAKFGTLSLVCNGSSSGCRHRPANIFEESPTPSTHRQRLEIHTGCDATCGNCQPARHSPPNDYARISVWVDCTACADTSVDLPRTPTPPTLSRCQRLDSRLNTVIAGFTTGFLVGQNTAQGVTLANFILRSE